MRTISENESNKIQVLRGLSIIAVVIIHNLPGGMMQVLWRPFFNFPVGCFLFLSGMLSDAARWKPGKRILKILVPYVIWTFIYVMMSGYNQLHLVPGAFLRHLIQGDTVAVMYYVFVYCELTLLIPLVDKLARSKYRYLGFVISPLEILVMRLLPLVLGYEMNSTVRIVMEVSCLGWFTYFYLGYMIGNELLKVNLPTRTLLLWLVAAVVLQICEGYWYFRMGAGNGGTQTKLSVLLTGTAIILLFYRYMSSKETPTCQVLKRLGDHSFGIFFSHLAVMVILLQIPYFSQIPWPVKAIVTLVLSYCLVAIGRKLLGKSGKLLAF
ncbi:MAG: acyltransferase [Clostridiales bacterium]|nr:acyltransferase [Clostridiales bacterium]